MGNHSEGRGSGPNSDVELTFCASNNENRGRPERDRRYGNLALDCRTPGTKQEHYIFDIAVSTAQLLRGQFPTQVTQIRSQVISRGSCVRNALLKWGRSANTSLGLLYSCGVVELSSLLLKPFVLLPSVKSHCSSFSTFKPQPRLLGPHAAPNNERTH
jgi:hypothetical protein